MQGGGAAPRPPEAEGRIQGTSGSLAGPGSARRGCRGSAPAQLLERRCNTPACEPPKRARKMKQAWKNETSFTPVFLRPSPYRARTIPSRGVLRRETRPPAGGNERKLGSKHRIQATTNGAQDSSNPYYPHPASRFGEHNENQPSPCEPLRRAQRKPIIPLRTVAASTTKTNHPPASRSRVTIPLRAVAVRTMLLSFVVLAAAARRGWRVQV